MENNKKVANENFDWTAYETDAELYGDLTKEQVAAQYDETVQKVHAGEVVEGVVTSINKREVVVNIGYCRIIRLVLPAGAYPPNFNLSG